MVFDLIITVKILKETIWKSGSLFCPGRTNRNLPDGWNLNLLLSMTLKKIHRKHFINYQILTSRHVIFISNSKVSILRNGKRYRVLGFDLHLPNRFEQNWVMLRLTLISLYMNATNKLYHMWFTFSIYSSHFHIARVLKLLYRWYLDGSLLDLDSKLKWGV